MRMVLKQTAICRHEFIWFWKQSHIPCECICFWNNHTFIHLNLNGFETSTHLPYEFICVLLYIYMKQTPISIWIHMLCEARTHFHMNSYCFFETNTPLHLISMVFKQSQFFQTWIYMFWNKHPFSIWIHMALKQTPISIWFICCCLYIYIYNNTHYPIECIWFLK